MKSEYLNELDSSFYHTDIENNTNNVNLMEKQNKNNSLENIFSDKTKTLKATVKALLEEIENRKSLNQNLTDKIEEGISINTIEIENINHLKVQYNFDMFQEMNKRKLKLEDRAHKLEEEKRREQVESWRDIMFLKKYLLSALREYWDVVKRREVLEGEKN